MNEPQPDPMGNSEDELPFSLLSTPDPPTSQTAIDYGHPFIQ